MNTTIYNGKSEAGTVVSKELDEMTPREKEALAEFLATLSFYGLKFEMEV